jgi:hypothetical protein
VRTIMPELMVEGLLVEVLAVELGLLLVWLARLLARVAVPLTAL